MKIIEPGHVYELHTLDGDGTPQTLTFVNREGEASHPGTQTQEVLRSLIDRTMHCDNCLRWSGNDKIIYHLRMALALHEARAIERKAEKGYYKPEQIVFDTDDGHYFIAEKPGDTDAQRYESKNEDEPTGLRQTKFQLQSGLICHSFHESCRCLNDAAQQSRVCATVSRTCRVKGNWLSSVLGLISKFLND